MDGIFDLFFIRITVAVGMLSIGCIMDIWKREVHDYLWLIFGGSGIILLVFEPDKLEIASATLFSLIIAPVVIMVWRMGFFGGADAFALIALAVIAPQLTFSQNVITPFTTLSNAAVLFVIPLLINALRNGISLLKKEKIFDGFDESTTRKIIASFIGYKAKNPKYGFSIEKNKGNSKKIVLPLHHAENTEFEIKPNTWITPGIPYLLLITAGFVIQVLFGDIIITTIDIGS